MDVQKQRIWKRNKSGSSVLQRDEVERFDVNGWNEVPRFHEILGLNN